MLHRRVRVCYFCYELLVLSPVEFNPCTETRELVTFRRNTSVQLTSVQSWISYIVTKATHVCHAAISLIVNTLQIFT